MHSNDECRVKCDALKTILTQIQQNAAMEDQYTIRHMAESGLDIVRDLSQEIKESGDVEA